MDRQNLYDQVIFVVRQFLTPEECDRFIARAESLDFQSATISTVLGPLEAKDYRDNDRVVPTKNSHLLAEHLPNARLKIYPDAGHGFLFQYPADFAGELERFFNDERSG